MSKEKVIAALSRHFRSPEAVRARDVGGLDYLVIDVVKGSPLIFGFILEEGGGRFRRGRTAATPSSSSPPRRSRQRPDAAGALGGSGSSP